MLALHCIWRLLGLVELVAVACANELLSNGGFSTVLPAGDTVDASRVVGESVFAFPGPSTISAMQLSPTGRSHVVLRSSAAGRSDGWYRCTGWSYATSDYNGATELTAVLVDNNDAPVALTSVFSATLASGIGNRRNQWIHFDEWVPSNVDSMNRVRLTFAPGHTSGILQLAQLSVTWEAFDARERYDLEAMEIWSENRVRLATIDCTLNLFGPGGECPESYGDGAQLRAFDGRMDTAFYASHATVPTVALEVDLGQTVEICGVVVSYDGGVNAAWIVKALGPTDGDVWRTWATAGGGTMASGAMQPLGCTSLCGPGETIAVRFGLMCMETQRIRIEMAAEGELSRLYEVALLSRTRPAARCDCRHGGQCLSDGSCVCPTSSSWPWQKSPSTAFGWAGASCNQAACSGEIVCSNDVPLGIGLCGGPNTCTCPAGWHTTTGINQCTTTVCGDGFITTEGPPGSLPEQCDDGNVVNGDGCDSRCQTEPLPQGAVRATRQHDNVIYRSEIIGATADPPIPPSAETVAATIGLPVERVCCVRVVPAPTRSLEVVPEDEVAYTWTEVYYRSANEEEQMCNNGGSMKLLNFQPVCECTPGYFGETCEQSLCERGCDHGSSCIGTDLCSACAAGWEGRYCGTASNSMRVMVVGVSLATASLLSVAGIVVVFKHAYVPIAARGAFGLFVNFGGGIIWLLSAVAHIQGESFGYDINAPAKWHLWIPLFGAGLWISSSLVYLRTMVALHIFHHVPTHFICAATVGIAPWAIACIVESYFVAVLAAALCFVYTLLLISQLWSLRAELLDESFDASAVMLAAVVVILQVVSDARGILNAEVGSQTNDNLGSDATLTFWCSATTVAIVLLHFLGTSAKLCYYALCKQNDQTILKLYHHEYEECAGAFHKVDTHQLHKEFDAKVKARREEHSRRNKAHQPDRHSSFKNIKEAITNRSPHNHPKVLGCLDRFSKTHAGGIVSATAKSRRQYASRRKISHPYQKYEAGGATKATRDFEARLRGAADNESLCHTDGDYTHLDKYRKGAPQYAQYNSSATTIQSAERGRQARKHAAKRRHARHHGGDCKYLPGQPIDGHHHHHHHHHHNFQQA